MNARDDAISVSGLLCLQNTPPTKETNAMNSISVVEPSLSSRAMLCSLSISMWSARKHDPDASQEIAQRHGAQADAGRYHKVLLPKEALAEVQKIVSDARQEKSRRGAQKARTSALRLCPGMTTGIGCFPAQPTWTIRRKCGSSRTGSIRLSRLWHASLEISWSRPPPQPLNSNRLRKAPKSHGRSRSTKHQPSC